MNKEECPVCFGKIWLTKTSCNHLICITCILELTENKCVYCRKKNVLIIYHCLLRMYVKCLKKRKN